ncbi:MAG: hypothetical protein LBI61_03275 [Puniceicoccales bacterium]|nr:hypothetical protein [Puniceicoccales bacterium]
MSVEYLVGAFSQMAVPSNPDGEEVKTFAGIAAEFSLLFSSSRENFEWSETDMFTSKKAAIDYLWKLSSDECTEILLTQVRGFSILHDIMFSLPNRDDWLSFCDLLRTLTNRDKQSCLQLVKSSDFYSSSSGRWPSHTAIGEACDALSYNFDGDYSNSNG